ncbi:MAG: hypothetical protein Q4G60_10745 [bacterium]|nr:hypothetical protein [bacterium]
MEILFKGTNIYPEISLHTCIHDMYAEKRADTLYMQFNDTRKRGDKWWASEKENKISVQLGAGKTGDMYIESLLPRNGIYELRAQSVPLHANNVTNKSWEAINFLQIAEEIAGRHGLGFRTFGVEENPTYEYVCQTKEDFKFLEERCVYEGCGFLVYNNDLILYGESALESETTRANINVRPDIKYEYDDRSNRAYGSCIIKNAYLEGSYSAEASSRVLEKVVDINITSQAEANRYAKNLLRYENKNMKKAAIYWDKYLPELAAGSVVKVSTPAAGTWDGTMFLNHVRHDYVTAKTKLFLRWTLGGY